MRQLSQDVGQNMQAMPENRERQRRQPAWNAWLRAIDGGIPVRFRKTAKPVCQRSVVRQQHAAVRRRADELVGVKAEAADISETSNRSATEAGAYGLACVFDHRNASRARDAADALHVDRHAIHVDRQDRFGARTDRFFQGGGIENAAARTNVYEFGALRRFRRSRSPS